MKVTKKRTLEQFTRDILKKEEDLKQSFVRETEIFITSEMKSDLSKDTMSELPITTRAIREYSIMPLLRKKSYRITLPTFRTKSTESIESMRRLIMRFPMLNLKLMRMTKT